MIEEARPARLKNVLWIVGVFIGVLAIWEAAVKLFALPSFILPPVESVVLDAVRSPMLFLTNAAYTVLTALAGFVCAAVVGLALSVAIVSSRILERIFVTLLALMNSIPKVALAPLFVIWLGTGFQPKIAIAALMPLLVIVVDTVAGMRGVDPEMLDLARVHQASRYAILFKVRFPHALPHLFGAWKTAISLSVIGAIVGEFVAGQHGLGYVIVVAQGEFDMARAFAAVVILSVAATILFYAVTYAESRLIKWHVSQRTNRA